MNNGDKDIVFNKEAKVWKPKNQVSKEEVSNIKNGIENIDINNQMNKNTLFNLNATEFKPKEEKFIEYVEDNGEQSDRDNISQEIDQNEKDIIDELVRNELAIEDEMNDEDNWFPQFQDCTCCKGFIYKCEGDVCNGLGACYCKSLDDNEEDI